MNLFVNFGLDFFSTENPNPLKFTTGYGPRDAVKGFLQKSGKKNVRQVETAVQNVGTGKDNITYKSGTLEQPSHSKTTLSNEHASRFKSENRHERLLIHFVYLKIARSQSNC